MTVDSGQRSSGQAFPLLSHSIQRQKPFVKTALFLLLLILRKKLPSTARMQQDALTHMRRRTHDPRNNH